MFFGKIRQDVVDMTNVRIARTLHECLVFSRLVFGLAEDCLCALLIG